MSRRQHVTFCTDLIQGWQSEQKPYHTYSTDTNNILAEGGEHKQKERDGASDSCSLQ